MDILSELNTLKADYSAAQALLEESKHTSEAHNKALAEKESALASLNELSAAQSKDIATLNAVIGGKDTELSNLRAELDNLKAKQKTAEEKAVEMMANVGIKPIKADQSSKQERKDRDEVLITLCGISDPMERANYYSAHRATLFGK
jgi:uncharacterized coiled-coil protein SlyX